MPHTNALKAAPGTAPTVRTLTTALAARGSVGYLRVESLKVPVVVEDARSVFGRSDYLVRPIGGEGQQWVAADRVRLDAAAYAHNPGRSTIGPMPVMDA